MAARPSRRTDAAQRLSRGRTYLRGSDFRDTATSPPGAQSHAVHPGARAFFEFLCPHADCDGTFDLSAAVNSVMRDESSHADGTLDCKGTRPRPGLMKGPCGVSVRYTHRGAVPRAIELTFSLRVSVRGQVLPRSLPVLRHRDDPLRVPVPQDAFQRSEHLGQPHPGDTGKQVPIFVMALDQAVVRDAGRKMVDVMIADIDREPVQPARQHQETRAFDRPGILVPVLAIARIGILEVVLHGE